MQYLYEIPNKDNITNKKKTIFFQIYILVQNYTFTLISIALLICP